jgi:hypothetical protein
MTEKDGASQGGRIAVVVEGVFFAGARFACGKLGWLRITETKRRLLRRAAQLKASLNAFLAMTI